MSLLLDTHVWVWWLRVWKGISVSFAGAMFGFWRGTMKEHSLALCD